MAPRRNEPRFRLADMDLDEISLVPAGDDPEARILLAKADKSADSGDGRRTLPRNRLDQEDENVAETPDLAEILAKAELPEEVTAYIEALEEEIDTLSANGGNGNGDDGGQGGDDNDDTDDTDEETDTEQEKVLAKADPEVRSMISKMNDDLKAARTEAQAAQAIAKAERDERLRREFVSKAEAMPMIGEKPSELGDLLMKLHEKAPDEAKRIEQLLTAANNQIAKSNLFGEFGKTGAAASLGSRVEAAVAELRKAEPSMTQEQAVAAVYSANPALYDEGE